MTEYSDLATQTSGGTPGSAWANQLINNQKALIHPPSARFINAAELGTTGTTTSPLVAGTYSKVAFVGLSDNDTVYPSATFGTQVWQTDVGVAATTTAFVDTANDTYAGFDVAFGFDLFEPADSFKVPSAGLWLISAWVGSPATTGTGTLSLALNGSRGAANAQFAGSTYGQNAHVSTILNLGTSSYFDLQVRHSTATTLNSGALSIIRLSENPNG